MSSLRLAVAAALAVLVSASPGAESRECAELGGCAVAPEGGTADHLLFQARAKMHKADTSAAEEGGEIHKSHKSAVEDSVSVEPVCQIREKRLTAGERGRGSREGFHSDGYGIVANVKMEGCTEANCNIDHPLTFPFAADLFTPVHTEGEKYKPGLCACNRAETDKTLIKWETNSYGGHTKNNCHAQQCWYEYAMAVYATEVKDWVTQWDTAVVKGYVTGKHFKGRDGVEKIIKQEGWDVGCVFITNPIEEENLMTVEGMLDKVGEHREGMCNEGVGITRGLDRRVCLTRRRVWEDMKGLVPGLKIKEEIQEKQPEMAPSEPEKPEKTEPEPGEPMELCAPMGEVVSKLEKCGQMIANEMNHVSDVQQNKNTGHEKFLGSAMEVLEAAVTDESHDSTFNNVLKMLTIVKTEKEETGDKEKYVELDNDMNEFTASRAKAKTDVSELRTAVGELPKDSVEELQESLDPVMLQLSKVMHDVLKGASIMSKAKRALMCP